MSAVAVYTKTGSKSTAKLTLPKAVFGTKTADHQMLQRAYLASEGNARQNLARTKTRTEVRGGGRKPHPQKGTGRARAGSSRNPIWRGGGVVFGPRGTENYRVGINKGAKKAALIQALSLAADNSRISVIDALALDGKTSSAAKLLAKLDMNRVLIVTDTADEKTSRSLKNLQGVAHTVASGLGTADVLKANHILITKPALAIIEQRLGAKS